MRLVDVDVSVFPLVCTRVEDDVMTWIAGVAMEAPEREDILDEYM